MLSSVFEGSLLGSFMFWLLILIGFAIFILIVFLYSIRIKSRDNEVREVELAMEKKKLEFMGKRMLIQELKEAARAPSDKERDTLGAIDVDNTILTKKVMHMMDEMERRGKRLELGADTANLLQTMKEIREKEQSIFGKRLD